MNWELSVILRGNKGSDGEARRIPSSRMKSDASHRKALTRMGAILVKGMALKQGVRQSKAALAALPLGIKMNSFDSLPVFRPGYGSEGKTESLLAAMDNKYDSSHDV